MPQDSFPLYVVSNASNHRVCRTITQVGYTGKPIVEVERFPKPEVESIIDRARSHWHNWADRPVADRIEIIADATRLFANEDLTTNCETYVEGAVSLTGLPRVVIKSALKQLTFSEDELADLLASQSPTGDLSAFDDWQFDTSAGPLSWVPKGRVVGLVTAGNNPKAIRPVLVALAMGFAVALRPSERDPLTSSRLVNALTCAGVPTEVIPLLPGSHGVAERVLKLADIGVGYGGESFEEHYRYEDAVHVYGPGNSTVFVDNGWNSEATLRQLVTAVLSGGGRTCMNPTVVYTTADGEVIASRLAEALGDIPILDPSHTDATVPAQPSDADAKDIANLLSEWVSNEKLRIVSTREDGIYQVDNGVSYLLPTVLYGGGETVPEREFPFQHITVTEVDGKPGSVTACLSGSIRTTLYTDRQKIVDEAILDPTIEQVDVRPNEFFGTDSPVPDSDPLSDVLFARKFVRR